jgi:Domain of unknown function (DUF1906)
MPYFTERTPTGRVVDTSTKLSMPGVFDAITGAGYLGVIRYVPLPENEATADIDAVELQAILGAGLGLLLVQHPRYPGWNPSTENGATDAATAIDFARAAGYAKGAHIFLDLEGIAAAATAEATIVFANAWAAAIVNSEYLAGCYVGYDVPLTAVQLYDLHDVNTYWSDDGQRAVATRGFAMKQGAGIKIASVSFDPDVVKPDQKGETPMWMTAAPVPVV